MDFILTQSLYIYIYISIDFRGREGGESKNQIILTNIPTFLSKIVARIFIHPKEKTFLKEESKHNKLYTILWGMYQRVRNSLHFWKIFLFCNLTFDFHDMV